MIIHISRNNGMIERHVRNELLQFSVNCNSIKPSGQALMAKWGKGGRKKQPSVKSVKALKPSSSYDKTCWKCEQPVHVTKHYKVNIIGHSEHVQEKESRMDNGGGEQRACAIVALVSSSV